MRVDIIGGEDPNHVVVSCVHGDEIAGWKAIQKFKESDHELKKSVKFILANEKAYEEDHSKFIDADLNRSFPGDLDSEKHEEQLAPKLAEEVEDMKVLDIHTTRSNVTPFAIIAGEDRRTLEIVKELSFERAANFPDVDGALISQQGAVSVEFKQYADESVEKAYQAIVNFLAGEAAIEGKSDTEKPEMFEVFDTEEGSGYEFLASNFQEVEEGEVYAKKEDSQKVAERDFYPVLMSTDGYDDMIGFKANKRDI